jgi:hypothetical protein
MQGPFRIAASWSPLESCNLIPATYDSFELLKTNQKEKAEELLETLIDLRVSSLSVHAANRKFDPEGQKIIDSIHKAKSYRQKYTSPTHKINENLKSGVEAAFKL